MVYFELEDSVGIKEELKKWDTGDYGVAMLIFTDSEKASVCRIREPLDIGAYIEFEYAPHVPERIAFSRHKISRLEYLYKESGGMIYKYHLTEER